MAVTRLRFTVVSEALQGHQVELLADQPVSVGRTKENALVLDHKSVSRRHARIERNGGKVVLIDLNSHNGTRVGDEKVSRHDLKPGDEITFGEITVQFVPVDASEATPSGALPAIVGDPTENMQVARPLTAADVFPQAEMPTETLEAEGEGGVRGTLLYTITLIGVVGIGLLAIWHVSKPLPREPVIEVTVRAGEVLPVNVDIDRRNARGGRARFGFSRVRRVGDPANESVAFALKSKFSTLVVVRGLSIGTTDIPLYGEPRGEVTLRVLVRGVKPPVDDDIASLAPEERIRRAKECILRANNAMPPAGTVNERTSTAIRLFERAVKLIGPDLAYAELATIATQKASMLRRQREAFFDTQAGDIATLTDQGLWRDVDTKMQSLLRVFNNPEEEEYHIVRAQYEWILEIMAEELQETQ